VPIRLLTLLLARRGLPAAEPREHSARWLDLTGLALLSPALALTVYGLSARTAGLSLPAAGVALLLAFGVHAPRTRSTAPLLDLRLFTHRPSAAASALNFFSRLSVFGAVILMPLSYQQVRGHSALTAGLLPVPQSLGTLLALPYVGKLTDRIGARPVFLTGITVTTLGTLAYTQVGSRTGDLVLGLALPGYTRSSSPAGPRSTLKTAPETAPWASRAVAGSSSLIPASSESMPTPGCADPKYTGCTSAFPVCTASSPRSRRYESAVSPSTKAARSASS
jgi:nitrate/nitrite transporter NarK